MPAKLRMLLKLSLIQSSPQPVRTPQDVAEIAKLTQSILQQGVIVPVKVRPVAGFPGACRRHGYRIFTHDGPCWTTVTRAEDDTSMVSCQHCKEILQWIWPIYVSEEGHQISSYHQMIEGDDPKNLPFEIVYGHRRVRAARLGHMLLIEAIVEKLDDSTALIQALIENVVREGLSNYDEGVGYIRLRDECDLGLKEIAQLAGKVESWVSECINFAEDETAQGLRPAEVVGGAGKAAAIRRALGDDLEARKVFASKVVNEGLTRAQTRDVAAALKRTQDPEVRKRILELPTADATIWESVAKREAKEKQEVEKSRWGYLDESPCAKNFIRHIKVNSQSLKRLWQDVERGALGIEHMPYVEERLRKYAEYIISLADALAKWRKEAIDGP